MGFTPWLYEASNTAVVTVYRQIQEHGDIVSHHMKDGIPWQQALLDAPYPQAVEDALAIRQSNTNADSVVYLSIDSLSPLRDGLALNWGSMSNEALPPPWSSYTHASPEVIEAYGNFAEDLIERFNPEYMNYAVEANVLLENDPAAFDDFVIFAEAIYTRLKSRFPDLTLMLSLSLRSPGTTEMQAIQQNFSRLANYVDVVGISVYPYAFFSHAERGNPDNLPQNWLTQIRTLAPGKPYAITETGWPAQDYVIPEFSIDVSVNATDQQNYVETLLAGAEEIDAGFVIWFAIDDFDSMWNTTLGRDPISRIWRDIGLFDEFLNARPALQNWDAEFDKSFAE